MGLDNNHGHCLDCEIGWQPGPDNTESVKEITSGSASAKRKMYMLRLEGVVETVKAIVLYCSK